MTTAPEELAYHARRVRRLGVPPQARDVRIVHELDGILNQVHPKALLRTGGALWEAWSQRTEFTVPDVLLGLDAGGILPTVAVALASDLPYRLAWKLDLDLPHKRRFAEPHARRTDVFTYGDLAGARVLIVDDEITTGNTLANLITVLRDSAVEVAGVACLIEDTTGNARPGTRRRTCRQPRTDLSPQSEHVISPRGSLLSVRGEYRQAPLSVISSTHGSVDSTSPTTAVGGAPARGDRAPASSASEGDDSESTGRTCGSQLAHDRAGCCSTAGSWDPA
jgi:adenine phosphoribosyltransferase